MSERLRYRVRAGDGERDRDRETNTPERQREMERETGKQGSLVRVLGRSAVPPCDPLAEPCKGLTVLSLLQLFELYPSFLKYFPGSHRQIYKNLQEINVFIGRSVEKHRETLDPNAPRDFIDCYLLRMEKVGFGRGNVVEGRRTKDVE